MQERPGAGSAAIDSSPVVAPAVARMAFETTLTVPTRDLVELTRRLSKAGFTVLDTGDRIATDHGLDAEATLRLVHLPVLEVELVEPEACALGISP